MTVFLVGAGPGDPGLVTVRGAEVLARADVVVYDRLSASALLDLAPPTAERIAVGKAPGRGPSQDEINALLVEHGRTGATVVRLKGGDPFVFARGGEEAAALGAAGVPFEVVPGISSAIAAPAYAGIPVTMRYSSTSFTVVTGHEDPATEGSGGSVDWEAIARTGGTVIILMGVARIATIVERLLAGGLAPDTPAAAVTWGTRPQQVTVRCTLSELPAQEVESPAVFVVGRVAAEELAWFEQRPLFGRSVVVTRSRSQASAMSSRLRALGAEPIELPTIAFEPPADGGDALRAAVVRLGEGAYDWLVLTSPNGVERLFADIADARDVRAKVAAIGPGTAAALADRRIVADLVPDRYVAEGLLEVFPPGPGRVVLARAEVARDALPDGLAAAGWEVDVVDAYRTVPATVGVEQLEAVAGADAITFTSSSTVEHFVAAAGTDHLPPVVACLGPVTAATARDLGITVDVEATEHTIDGLVSALSAHLRR